MITRISHTPNGARGVLPAGAKWIASPLAYRSPYRVKPRGERWTVIEPGGRIVYFDGQEAACEHAVREYRRTVVPQLLAQPQRLDPLREATALACSCPPGMPCHGDVLIELLAQSRGQLPAARKPGLQLATA